MVRNLNTHEVDVQETTRKKPQTDQLQLCSLCSPPRLREPPRAGHPQPQAHSPDRARAQQTDPSHFSECKPPAAHLPTIQPLAFPRSLNSWGAGCYEVLPFYHPDRGLMEHPITEPGCYGRMAGVSSGLNPSAQTTPPPQIQDLSLVLWIIGVHSWTAQ